VAGSQPIATSESSEACELSPRSPNSSYRFIRLQELSYVVYPQSVARVLRESRCRGPSTAFVRSLLLGRSLFRWRNSTPVQGKINGVGGGYFCGNGSVYVEISQGWFLCSGLFGRPGHFPSGCSPALTDAKRRFPSGMTTRRATANATRRFPSGMTTNPVTANQVTANPASED